jgi:putative ABC transport system permease protein
MLQDLAIALRTLAKKPGYACSVILTLTLGIGATSMMFSLLDAAILRALPFVEPERLVMLQGVFGRDRDVRGASVPEVLDWRSMNRTLTDVSVFTRTSLNLRLGNEAVRAATEVVSAGYFNLLGARPALGRTFLQEEDQTPDARPVAVISHRLWKERLGARADVFSTPIYLNDRQFSIVGVMPERFAGLSFDTELWIPSMMLTLTMSPEGVYNRGNRWLFAVARPKQDVTVAQAQADLDRVAAILEKEYPDTNTERGVQIVGVKEALLGPTGTLVAALFGAVLLFLLIACANVASLQLARTMAKRRELAVRLALGAGRWRVLRHLLAESMVLAAIAGVGGALLAAWGVSAADTLMPERALPLYVQPSIDVRSLAFTVLASFLSGALVAVLPAIFYSRNDLTEAMKSGGRAVNAGLGTIRRPSIQQLVVIGEMALAMTLLAGAGLLARSLAEQLRVPVGFDPGGVTAARISLPPARYPVQLRAVFVDRLNESLKGLPDVSSASIGSDLPLRDSSNASRFSPDIDPRNSIRFYRHRVTPEYFRTLGIPLLSGRAFTPQDRAGAPSVAIINEAAARRLWGGAQQAIGRTIRFGAAATSTEIVGVVANARFRNLTTDLTTATAEPDIFVPQPQSSDRDLDLAVKSASGAPISVSTLQRAVSLIDAGLPVYDVRLLDDAVARQTATMRFASGLLAVFSGGALLLAALGVYGLVSYIVSLSGREVALRLALGADRRRVMLHILANGTVLVLAGVVIGLGGAAAAGRAVQAQLFRTGPMDPLTIGSVAVVLTAVALVAILLPARRAARIDPSIALRAE